MGGTIGLAILGTIFAGVISAEMASRLSALTAGMPPEMRAQLEQPRGGGEEGGHKQEAPNKEEIEAEIHQQFEAVRKRYVAALQGHDPKALEALRQDPQLPEVAKKFLPASVDEVPPGALERALAFNRAAEEGVLATIGQVAQAKKEAFASAISTLFRVCILLAILGFVVTLFMPELPLRKTEGPALVSE
jgi:hypothetical protein